MKSFEWFCLIQMIFWITMINFFRNNFILISNHRFLIRLAFAGFILMILYVLSNVSLISISIFIFTFLIPVNLQNL